MKIINLSYGLKGGKGKLYTYLVNDNVRRGQVVFPNVKHYISGKVYGTLGIAQQTMNAVGKKAKGQIATLEGEGKSVTGTALTGKGAYNEGRSISKTEKDENGNYIGTQEAIENYDKGKVGQEYIKNRKAEAVKDRVASDYQTSDEYADQFEWDERSGR